MIDLKEAAKNPGYSLSAMIYGLQNPIETKDVKYEVDMRTFGSFSKHGTICYGCAATSALEVITGRSLIEHGARHTTAPFLDSSNSWRRTCFTSVAFNTDEDQQNDFEPAIDKARAGRFTALMKFFGHQYHKQYDEKYNQDGIDLYLNSSNWQDRVPAFEKVIERMHKDYPEWEQFKTIGRTV